ncbi:hypothetical protein CEXT_589791 [Caerostris extrusa]|uniref:Uncharacterized protein n=1 Tax=Caerostris extrusa TaxID=172846 RepID=A0AAV4NXR9_CAEEX|nr:hypothetical protein CEXT_589791 [Caerostris extrusa]
MRNSSVSSLNECNRTRFVYPRCTSTLPSDHIQQSIERIDSTAKPFPPLSDTPSPLKKGQVYCASLPANELPSSLCLVRLLVKRLQYGKSLRREKNDTQKGKTKRKRKRKKKNVRFGVVYGCGVEERKNLTLLKELINGQYFKDMGSRTL